MVRLSRTICILSFKNAQYQAKLTSSHFRGEEMRAHFFSSQWLRGGEGLSARAPVSGYHPHGGRETPNPSLFFLCSHIRDRKKRGVFCILTRNGVQAICSRVEIVMHAFYMYTFSQLYELSRFRVWLGIQTRTDTKSESSLSRSPTLSACYYPKTSGLSVKSNVIKNARGLATRMVDNWAVRCVLITFRVDLGG